MEKKTTRQAWLRIKPAGHRLFMLGLVLLAAVVLICPAAGYAADYYVDIQNGNDISGDGSETNPWKTLHNACTILGEFATPNTLHVAPGIYSVANGEDETTLYLPTSDFTLQGPELGGAVVDATATPGYWSYGLNLDYCTNVTVADMEVINAEQFGIYINGGNNNTITNCILHNNASSGIFLSECDATTIVNGNVLYDNPTGIDLSATGSAASAVVINNLIRQGLDASMDTGIFVDVTGSTTMAEPRIHHNTIDGAFSYGIRLNRGDIAPISPDMQYNIITNCGTGIADTGTDDSTPTALDYNNLFGNTTAYSGTNITAGPNSLNQDPLYYDAGNNDYHLTESSPCVDAADTSTTSQDLDGNARPQGTAPDIGCYEFLSTGANSPPDTPTHVSPEPFALIAPGQPVTLEASAFSDPDGDSHVSSYWRVTRADIDHFSSTVGPFNYETSTYLTSYTLEDDPNYPDQQLIEGLAYYWKVGYMDSGSGRYSWTEEPTELEVPPDVFVIGTQETSTSPPVPPGETAAAYQMLSAHHIPDDPRPAAVIGDDLAGGYDSTQYRLGVYDCEQGAYQEYPDFMIYPGGAMWVLAREGLSIDITGVPVATGVDVETSLRYNGGSGNGWNMVGPPNDRSYLWSDIEVVEYDPNNGQELSSQPIGDLAADNPYIDIRLWEWDNGQYYNTSTMEAGAGYWVRAKRPNINLRFTVGAQVAWSNPGVMLAAAGQRVKNLAGAILGGSEAVAGDDETPPAPMAALDSSDKEKSSVDVTCFITSIWK
ncbi:MAG: right-handed parallel beta-helix repeat-containing protein [Desulfosudaceae bacterium]